MSGQEYIHNNTGWRFLALHRGLVLTVMKRIEPEHPFEWGVLTARVASDFTRVDDVFALAEAVGVVAAPRVPGVQPAVEFTSGPIEHDHPFFTDEYLAALVSRWSQESAR